MRIYYVVNYIVSQFWDSQAENRIISTVCCFMHLKTQILLFLIWFVMNMQYTILDSFLFSSIYIYQNKKWLHKEAYVSIVPVTGKISFDYFKPRGMKQAV